jgi:hypothetical protein
LGTGAIDAFLALTQLRSRLLAVCLFFGFKLGFLSEHILKLNDRASNRPNFIGAVDFVTKPDFTQLQDAPEVRDSLVQKVLALRSRASGTAIAAGAAPVSATSLNMAAAGPASAVPAVVVPCAAAR